MVLVLVIAGFVASLSGSALALLAGYSFLTAMALYPVFGMIGLGVTAALLASRTLAGNRAAVAVAG